MTITMIAAALPPQLDGIGDYSAALSKELAQQVDIQVTVLSGQSNPLEIADGVSVETIFSPQRPKSVRALFDRIRQAPPDWILVQYNAFSYGRRGWNPYLPLTLQSIKRVLPGTAIAIMVHEPFMPAISTKAAVMSLYQRWQLWKLGNNADVLFFSIEAWTKRFQSWFPRKTVNHLPVSSNIPLELNDRTAQRAKLSLDRTSVALGLFGTAAGGRSLPLVKSAAERVAKNGTKVCLVYIGPDGARVRESLAPIPVHNCGPLAPADVSRVFGAIDIYLAPFVDGVSTRRTNLMTALQHGLAIAGTKGALTDSVLSLENGKAFILADAESKTHFPSVVFKLAVDSGLRERLRKGASDLFQQEFTWPRIASKMLNVMASVRQHCVGN